MQTTYLADYKNENIAYLPVGTFEWHGNHLPLETDVIVAEKFCEEISREIPGFIMPGIWIATDRKEGDLRGMEKYLGKHLEGQAYRIEPELLMQTVDRVVKNLLMDFKKVIIISGHGGSTQTNTLAEVDKLNQNAIFVSPYTDLEIDDFMHADQYETSMLWYCRPKEESISRKINIPENDDYFVFLGHDPREKASFDLGKKLFDMMRSKMINEIKERL